MLALPSAPAAGPAPADLRRHRPGLRRRRVPSSAACSRSTCASRDAGHRAPTAPGCPTASASRWWPPTSCCSRSSRSACSPSGRCTRPSATTSRTPALALGLVGADRAWRSSTRRPTSTPQIEAAGADERWHVQRRCSTRSPASCIALAIVGVVFSAVTAFRYLGGRTTDREVVVGACAVLVLPRASCSRCCGSWST